MTKLLKEPTESSQHKHFTLFILLCWKCAFAHFPVPQTGWDHQDLHHCLLPIQELVLNLAMVSILIPHRHFWKRLLNH